MKRLIILGAGGHGKVVADIAQKTDAYQEIAFLDDNVSGDCMGYPVLGEIDTAEQYINDSDLLVAVGNSAFREKMMSELLDKGASMPVLIHPSAVIGCDVSIGCGSVIMAGAVINPCAKIGNGVIINTVSSVDHDCVIGDYSHVSVGATVAGKVSVGRHVWIGAGATVINNVSITDSCIIGAGAVVIRSIDDAGTYLGVPAQKRE